MEPTSISDTTWIRHFAEIMAIILATIGGVARFLAVYLATGVMPRFGQFLAHIFVSGFCGYFLAEIVNHFYPQWTHAAAGIGGYLGTQTIDFVTLVVKKKIEKQFDVSTDSKKDDGDVEIHYHVHRSKE